MRLSTILLVAAAVPGTESVTFESTRLGTCNCVEDFCPVTTIEACDEAARQYGVNDGANRIYSQNVVAGCSTNKLGGLRFNMALDSTVVHGDHDEDLRVFCMPCSPFDFALEQLNHAPCPSDIAVTDPANGDITQFTSEQEFSADTMCECEGLCSIETLEECEATAAARGYPDTNANQLDTMSVVSGCSTNKHKGLRFNSAVSDTLHTASRGKDILCKPCEGTVPLPPVACTLDLIPGAASQAFAMPENKRCSNAYCQIQTEAECLEASNFFNLGDDSLTIVNQNNRVGGCSTSLQDGLTFNTDFDIRRAHDPQFSEHVVLCKACPVEPDVTTVTVATAPITTVTTAMASHMLSSDACTGDYCPVMSDTDCLAAVSQVDISNIGIPTPTSVTTITSNIVPAGCTIAGSSGLRFNSESTSPALPSGRGNKFICELCPATSSLSDRADTDDDTRISTKDGDKWWIYLVGGAATVAVVAVVVVAVTVAKARKSRKVVTPVNRRTVEEEAGSVDIVSSQSVEI